MTWPMRQVVLAVMLAGCAGPRRGPPDPSAMRYPGELVPAAALAGRGDFLARQSLLGRQGEREIHGEVIVQKRGAALTLIGMTPFGSKAFVIQQDADGVKSQEVMAGALPFPAQFMLLDVHRALFMGLVDRPAGDGERSWARAGEKVTETWQGGALMRRSFVRLDGRPPGTITVEYVGGWAGERPPERVVLDNGWFGYRIEIHTVSWQAI